MRAHERRVGEVDEQREEIVERDVGLELPAALDDEATALGERDDRLEAATSGLETMRVISRSASVQTSWRATLRPASSSRRNRSMPGDDNRSPALACLRSSTMPLSSRASPRPVQGFCAFAATLVKGVTPSHACRTRAAPSAPPSDRCGEVDPKRAELPGHERRPEERAGFSDAPEIGPPTSDARAIVPPIATAAAPDGTCIGCDRKDHDEQRSPSSAPPRRTTAHRIRTASSHRGSPTSPSDERSTRAAAIAPATCAPQ